MKILVTGVAGFIDVHVDTHLLERGDQMVGVDHIDDDYSVKLDFAGRAAMEALFAEEPFHEVVNLAAQAGVRFGNMLGSTGSIIPKFPDPVVAGGPVTVAHPRLRIAKSRGVDAQWLERLLVWLKKDGMPSDAEVKAGLAKWGAEYRTPATAEVQNVTEIQAHA